MKPQFEVPADGSMKMFRIVGKFYGEKTFPSLNNYLHECAKNPKAGARMKREYQMIACNAMRLQLRRWKAEKPIILHYRFFEPNRGQRRDFLNVFDFCDKVIADALQDCQIIPNDDPKHLLNATHDFYYTDQTPFIEVYIEEVDE